MIELRATLQRGGFSLEADFRSEARVIGIFGPSGSGKTTVLHALAGLLKPREGRLIVDDIPFFASDTGTFLPPQRRRVGYVFQENLLLPHLNVRANLLFGYKRLPAARRRLDPDAVFDLLDLVPLLQRRTTALSGGEAKRVAIGRALLCSPRLLMLDEPLSGLDLKLRRTLLAYLLRLHKRLDLHMIYVSHTLSDFRALVDETAHIKAGRLYGVGAPQHLMSDLLPTEEPETLETMLEGHVEAYGPESGLARINTGKVVLTAPLDGGKKGDAALIIVRADDVVLLKDLPGATSARNILNGTVTALKSQRNGVVATVDVGHPLWVELTSDAVESLGLKKGSTVHALLKARALRAVAM